MLRVLQNDFSDPGRFLITLELVPGRESFGQSVETVKGIAADAFADGRISAVSITDNPGGNPSLSPDVIGHAIFKVAIKNIPTLSGDYTGRGFGGQGAPVFDLDSVNLLIMLSKLGDRIQTSGDPDGYFTGVAVSPFKYTEGESYAQYAKLCRKTAAGARFVITQLGYDARKYDELLRMQRVMGLDLPVLGSVYLLSPKAARAMNRGVVPGAFVPDSLLQQVLREWKDTRQGLTRAIERAARLAAVLKGLGYRGVHLGGVHRSFKTVARILDRLEEIQDDWQAYMAEFNFGPQDGFYTFPVSQTSDNVRPCYGRGDRRLSRAERVNYLSMGMFHHWFFNHQSPLAPHLERACLFLDRYPFTRGLADVMEGIPKKILLDCRRCGDCGIQHLAFLCPESKCPKHTRNGACGGGKGGRCEVYPEKQCVWFRVYQRLASAGRLDEMTTACVPPRMWALDRTPSWINFHLKRDHQAVPNFQNWCRPNCDRS